MTSGLSDLGRFSEPAVLILIGPAVGAKHGYAMQDDIAELEAFTKLDAGL